MGLLIAIIVLCAIWTTHLPATYSLRRGKEMYWETKRKHNAMCMREAAEDDCYYNVETGWKNQYFYGDGSVKLDTTTGRHHAKGQYYCRSDGIGANYHQVDINTPRPPK